MINVKFRSDRKEEQNPETIITCQSNNHVSVAVIHDCSKVFAPLSQCFSPPTSEQHCVPLGRLRLVEEVER